MKIDIFKPDNQVILFLFGPHWIKVPPLGLVYLENFLSSKGFKTKIIDLNIIFYNLLKLPKKDWLSLNPELENKIYKQIKEKFPELIKELICQTANSKAKILGFSLFNRNRSAAIEFAKDILRLNPDKTLVFGGPEILFEFYRDSFFKEINSDNSFFVLGEGEIPLLNICKHIYNSEEISFSLHKEKRIIKYNEINNLDSLPLLNFKKINLESYNAQTLPLFSSRGCIKRCSFCCECKLYSNFRQHSPEYMVELIKNLTQKYKITTFSFHDSLINANLDWLDEFCSALQNLTRSGVKWEAQFIVRKDLTEDLLKKIKGSGCYNLFVGLESGCDKILKLMRKGYDTQQAKDFLRKLSSAGLQFEISLITGFPDETESDFKETLEFLRENKKYIPKIAQVNPFVEYSPSEINKQNAELGLIAKNRVKQLLEMFEEEKIKYTASFINNLIQNS